MPENISFQGIPVGRRSPGIYIEVDQTQAVQGLPLQPRKLLILGQRLSTGTVLAGVQTRIFSASAAKGQFGRGSMLAAMIIAAKAANPYADMYAIALDDNGAGVAATWVLTFSGPATAPGTINFYGTGQQGQIGVASGDSAATIATSFAARINALPDYPFTAAAVGAAVTLTARHKGECGNHFDLRFNYYEGELFPAGVGCAIAAGVAGSGNPGITPAIAAMEGKQFYSIAMPWTDGANLTALETEMSTRFGPMAQKTGHFFCGLSATQGAAASFGDARNSIHGSYLPFYKSPSPPWEVAAIFAAKCEQRGAIDPGRQFRDIVLTGIMPPAVGDRYSEDESELLLFDAMTSWTVDAGNQVRLGRVITSYQRNGLGIEDESMLDLTTKWTVDYIRYAIHARIALRYPDFKLIGDDEEKPTGQAVVRPKDIRMTLIELMRELRAVALVEDIDQFIDDLIVVRSDSDKNRINAIIPPNIVNNFMILAAAVQYRL